MASNHTDRATRDVHLGQQNSLVAAGGCVVQRRSVLLPANLQKELELQFNFTMISGEC